MDEKGFLPANGWGLCNGGNIFPILVACSEADEPSSGTGERVSGECLAALAAAFQAQVLGGGDHLIVAQHMAQDGLDRSDGDASGFLARGPEVTLSDVMADAYTTDPHDGGTEGHRQGVVERV